MVTACVIERARENRLRLSSARSHMHAQMCMDDEIFIMIMKKMIEWALI